MGLVGISHVGRAGSEILLNINITLKTNDWNDFLGYNLVYSFVFYIGQILDLLMGLL